MPIDFLNIYCIITLNLKTRLTNPFRQLHVNTFRKEEEI